MIQKKSIWLIDDDPIYKIIMMKIIDKSNLFSTVTSFSNGKEAILALTANINENCNIPDIILLDIEMPIMDGWGFMDEIKKINSLLIPNIYISSSSIAFEDKEKAKNNTSILGYLSKPIKLEDLTFIANN
ncbi:response regulator [Flavobacterium sp. UMI-01]|uniref:response regulator n=1 Tax=Flavobacterium sp. UMI-01 TaxID=1441053 RepID=UPI0020841825|nr:response regulator [Flavobacterium sp. UMI-01]GIZ10579.1 response regulator [Flavobacterium sp. UMI-01]